MTGESIPQIKDSIEKMGADEEVDLKAKHKNCVLFCGTEVLQVFPSSAHNIPALQQVQKKGSSSQQNQMCIARVLRTGYDTSKGKLIRTVLFNNENLQVK